jgi:biopolymer transport protein TolR
MAATEHLSASQRGKIRRLSQPKDLAPDEEGGELNVVPFLDIITNVLMFVLATVSVTFTAIIDTNPPRLGGSGGRPPTVPTLSLNIVVLQDGFLISAVGRRIAPGCTGEGSGLAVGKKDGNYDYEALTDCAKKLKALSADFASECQATVTANGDIPYQTIVSTLDAIRGKPLGEKEACTAEHMFPQINFGVPR